ncbi:spermidine synthase [Streptomyces sp. NPDC001380]|uniref:spermine/spermidine synthase domain-containing protein n=1 Tax=Streptomyces sp. NPDC001380 TaxID=3364566 RepID=UPI0036B07E98
MTSATPPTAAALAVRTAHPTAEVLDRRDGPYGEVVLRRRGEGADEVFEIIANGCFLMDTSDGRSERLLVRAALDAAAVPHPSVLVGGLGAGFSLAEAAADPAVSRITVLEREKAVVEWHAGPLGRFSAGSLDDPRTEVVTADLLDHLRATSDRWDVLCLDIDNGPDWTVTDANGGLYGFAGLTVLQRVLAPLGVLAVWSAAPAPVFEERLRARFARVRRLDVEVRRGAPDVVYLASQVE